MYKNSFITTTSSLSKILALNSQKRNKKGENIINKTKIDWCDSTWNPVTGCMHGCEYCYAKSITKRFGGANCGEMDYEGKTIWTFEGEETGKNHVLDEPVKWYSDDGRTVKTAPYPFYFDPTFHRYRLNDYRNKRGRNIFICSTADLFGSWIPDDWIDDVFAACIRSPQHNYLFLTKNPGRYGLRMNYATLPHGDNFWYGSTVTKPGTPAFVTEKRNTFVSIEPILEPFDNNHGKSGCIPKANWIIVGAETGRRKGKVVPKREWIEQIVENCKTYRIPLFMKSSLVEIWGEPLIQEFPGQLTIKREGSRK